MILGILSYCQNNTGSQKTQWRESLICATISDTHSLSYVWADSGIGSGSGRGSGTGIDEMESLHEVVFDTI